MQDVNVTVRCRELPQSGSWQHLGIDREVLAAGVQDTCSQVSQRGHEALEILPRWFGDQVHVIGHPDVPVDLDSDSTDHEVLDSVGVKDGEDALGVEGQ